MVGPDPHLGTVLHGRYLVSERLAEGAMAVVYRGERVGLKRQVAIKFLHESYSASEDGMRRFEVEARAMSRLAHPNCVAVTDFGVENGAPYLVMDFVTGSSLRDVLEAEVRMRPTRAVAVVRQVLAGLTHAHGQGIVHRDVKPENIVISPVEGHGEQVRILDFGLAKLRDENSVTSGLAVGTPGYMAPEQTIGEKVDERADLYATGIILFELIAGRKPFQAESPFDVMRMHRESPIPPLSAAAPGVTISSELEDVVRRALAKSRAERFSTAGSFLEALEATPEAEGSQVSSARAPGRSGRVMAAVGAALVLATGSAAAVFWLLTKETDGAAATSERAAVVDSVPATAPPAGPAGSGAPAATEPAAPAADAPDPAEPAEPGAPTASTDDGPTRDGPAEQEAMPEEPADIARLRARAADGDRRSVVRALERIRSRSPKRPEVYYALGNLYAELNAWRPSVEAYDEALKLESAYRRDQRLISDVVEALASDLAHGHAAKIIRKKLGAAAVPRLEQAMRSASPRQRVRARRLRARMR
jgi:eukaryotic-like serine/threonine-protein kinase